MSIPSVYVKDLVIGNVKNTVAIYRKMAAWIAILFPIIVILIISLAIAKSGVQSNAVQPRLPIFGVGIIAMILWIVRYYKWALLAISDRSEAISVTQDYVKFFNHSVAVHEGMRFDIKGRYIFLIDEFDKSVKCSKVFISSSILKIN